MTTTALLVQKVIPMYQESPSGTWRRDSQQNDATASKILSEEGLRITGRSGTSSSFVLMLAHPVRIASIESNEPIRLVSVQSDKQLQLQRDLNIPGLSANPRKPDLTDIAKHFAATSVEVRFGPIQDYTQLRLSLNVLDEVRLDPLEARLAQTMAGSTAGPRVTLQCADGKVAVSAIAACASSPFIYRLLNGSGGFKQQQDAVVMCCRSGDEDKDSANFSVAAAKEVSHIMTRRTIPGRISPEAINLLHHLEMIEDAEQAWPVLIAGLTVENCIGAMEAAELHGNASARKAAFRFFRKHLHRYRVDDFAALAAALSPTKAEEEEEEKAGDN